MAARITRTLSRLRKQLSDENPYESPNAPESARVASVATRFGWWRGIVAGVLSMLLFAIPLAVGAVITYAYWEINNISTFDRNYDIGWWKLRAFPAVVLIPLMLFFSGFTNYSLATCLLYTSPSPRDGLLSRMPSSA